MRKKILKDMIHNAEYKLQTAQAPQIGRVKPNRDIYKEK